MKNLNIKTLDNFLSIKYIEGTKFLAILQEKARIYSPDYHGGLWKIKEYGDIFYFELDSNKKEFNVINPLNYYEGVMGKEAFILGLFSMAISEFTFYLNEKCNKEGLSFYTDLYYELRDNIDKIIDKKDINEYYSFID